jgi:hypothetical protein
LNKIKWEIVEVIARTTIAGHMRPGSLSLRREMWVIAFGHYLYLEWNTGERCQKPVFGEISRFTSGRLHSQR